GTQFAIWAAPPIVWRVVHRNQISLSAVCYKNREVCGGNSLPPYPIFPLRGACAKTLRLLAPLIQRRSRSAHGAGKDERGKTSSENQVCLISSRYNLPK